MVKRKPRTYNADMKTVLLTNEEGESLGTCEIVEAHSNGGQLHKAYSVFVFNPEKTKMIIQRRAEGKMLWAGHWANTCCSHPQEDGNIEDQAAKRLQEECGFTCELEPMGSFVYHASDPKGNGAEYEYDTILVGTVSEDTKLKPNPDEASDVKWVDLPSLKKGMQMYPDAYAPWFRLALPKVLHEQ